MSRLSQSLFWRWVPWQARTQDASPGAGGAGPGASGASGLEEQHRTGPAWSGQSWLSCQETCVVKGWAHRKPCWSHQGDWRVSGGCRTCTMGRPPVCRAGSWLKWSPSYTQAGAAWKIQEEKGVLNPSLLWKTQEELLNNNRKSKMAKGRAYFRADTPNHPAVHPPETPHNSSCCQPAVFEALWSVSEPSRRLWFF